VEAGVSVPPAARGSLRDLASEKRKRLTITTNYRMAANAAFVKAGATDVRAHQFPCYELVRIAARRTPRGFVRRKGALTPAPGQDWPARFVAAGGDLYEKGARMIAAKTSDVWQKLGDGAGGHTDTLGNPYAPFAFGSGYGLREVPREEALLIGVPFEDRAPAAKPMTLKADAKKLSPAVLAAIKDLELRDKQTVSLSERAREEARAAVRAYQLKNRLGVLCELLNARTRDPSAAARKGWETRRRRGWTPLQIQEARRGMNAMKTVLATKQDVMEALKVPGLGPVDFRWSVGPRGIRRIYEDHKIARRIPLILLRGKVTRGPTRAFVDYKGQRVVLAGNLFGQPTNHWVLTGYRDKTKNHPMNSAKIPIRQSLRSSGLHVLRSGGGADGMLNNAHLHARCKGLLNLLHGHV